MGVPNVHKIALADADTQLQSAIVAWLIGRIEAGDISTLINAGVAADTLDEVRQISARLQSRLAAMRRPFVAIEIDFSVLKGALHSIVKADAYRDQLAYFIEHGATNPMLRQLFSLSRAEITDTRHMLQSQDAKGGRTALPPHDERMSIYARWRAITAESQVHPHADYRHQLMDLHFAFDARYSLATLYAIVNEFGLLE